MVEMKSSKEKKSHSARAQAIVEFAIALPVLLLLLLGIFEVGRYMFIYSSVTNASRNAVRYASAIGKNDSGLTKYNYCYGIYDAAKKSAFLVPFPLPPISDTDPTNPNRNFDITYDNGTGTPLADSICTGYDPATVDNTVKVSSGDRVTVTVTVQYSPILRLIPLTTRPIISRSSRTILGIVQLQPQP